MHLHIFGVASDALRYAVLRRYGKDERRKVLTPLVLPIVGFIGDHSNLITQTRLPCNLQLRGCKKYTIFRDTLCRCRCRVSSELEAGATESAALSGGSSPALPYHRHLPGRGFSLSSPCFELTPAASTGDTPSGAGGQVKLGVPNGKLLGRTKQSRANGGGVQYKIELYPVATIVSTARRGFSATRVVRRARRRQEPRQGGAQSCRRIAFSLSLGPLRVRVGGPAGG